MHQPRAALIGIGLAVSHGMVYVPVATALEP
jgi:hypothetical protein